VAIGLTHLGQQSIEEKAAMPYFSIQTNRPLTDDIVAAIGKKTSAFAAELLGKPEAYVMTALTAGCPMTFAGSDAPAAFVEVKSIGLQEAQCGTAAQKISAFIREELGIEPDRVYIELMDLPRPRFAWNGKTFG
jgi:phenylpyruvate tautomerase